MNDNQNPWKTTKTHEKQPKSMESWATMKTRACAKPVVRPKAYFSSLTISAVDAISSITTTNRDDHEDDNEHGDDDNFKININMKTWSRRWNDYFKVCQPVLEE